MTIAKVSAIISLAVADVAHLVERHLAKVEVASSSLVIRSITESYDSVFSFVNKKSPWKLIHGDNFLISHCFFWELCRLCRP